MATVTTVAASIGTYVTYTGAMHIIVDFDETMTKYKLLNPLVGNSKLNVLGSNLSPTEHVATCVEHQGHKYLRTCKGCIISLRTGRVMNWASDCGNRLAILAA